jgi:integrase-like protein
MSIRYSVRYVLQGRYQGLFLFDAAFDLTWLTCLSSESEHLPGTLRSPVQITLGTELASAGIDLLALRELMGHANPETTAAYVHLSPETLAAEYARARAAAR